MPTVSKANIEHHFAGYLTNDGLYDQPLSLVREAVIIAAGIIADALGLEDSEDADAAELDGVIDFTRNCMKVRECDRRDLASSVRAVMRNSFVATLSAEDRERLAARVTEALAELARRE